MRFPCRLTACDCPYLATIFATLPVVWTCRTKFYATTLDRGYIVTLALSVAAMPCQRLILCRGDLRRDLTQTDRSVLFVVPLIS